MHAGNLPLSRRLIVLGYLALLAYCLITALSIVAIRAAVSHANPYVAAFYPFLMGALFFNIINYKKLPQTYSAIKKDKLSVFMINLMSVLIWVPVFLGLKLVTPTSFLAIDFGSLPLMAVILQSYENKSVNVPQLLLAIIIALVIVGIALSSNAYHPDPEHVMLGYLLALAVGVSFSFYAKFSKRLEKTVHYYPVQILSVRFLLIVIICLLLSASYADISVFYHNINFIQMILITLFSTILPIYCVQKSLQLLGVGKTMSLLPLTLIMMYVLELINGVAFDGMLCVLVVILSVLLWGITVLQIKKG
jgi:drug/metabolite transporter (DMT)-like permease